MTSFGNKYMSMVEIRRITKEVKAVDNQNSLKGKDDQKEF